jgi:protein-disulfide isomerase
MSKVGKSENSFIPTFYFRHSTFFLTHMKRFLPLAFSLLFVAACVDTTGLSAESSRPVHPKSNADAVVIVQEFADLQCPACKAAHEAIVKPLLEAQGSKIRYEFRHFPLRSIHRYALEAAEASECAADQGKFWEFVDMNYEKQSDLSNETLRQWAVQLKLNMDVFDRCVKSEIKRDHVMAEYEAGKKLGVTGTPSFFVNGKKVESNFDAITKAIGDASAGMMQKL